MQKGKDLYLRLALYGIVFVGSVFLAIYFLLQARINQREFGDIVTAQKIEENMPIGFVVKKFGISEQAIYQELRLPANRWNRRYTIAQVCQKNRLDCSVVVDNLNKKIAK
ncbi:MAG: hypothetical protein WC823_01240 [Parcubacteria group bacterium]|jgi:hypothetical protein